MPVGISSVLAFHASCFICAARRRLPATLIDDTDLQRNSHSWGEGSIHQSHSGCGLGVVPTNASPSRTHLALRRLSVAATILPDPRTPCFSSLEVNKSFFLIVARQDYGFFFSESTLKGETVRRGWGTHAEFQGTCVMTENLPHDAVSLAQDVNPCLSHQGPLAHPTPWPQVRRTLSSLASQTPPQASDTL